MKKPIFRQAKNDLLNEQLSENETIQKIRTALN